MRRHVWTELEHDLGVTAERDCRRCRPRPAPSVDVGAHAAEGAKRQQPARVQRPTPGVEHVADRKPRAGFLGTELSLLAHGTLLVVMPNGYGVDVIGEPGAAARTQAAAAPLIHLPPADAGGVALADSAITAVRRITSAAGIHLAVPRATVTATAAPGGVDVIAWAAVAAGIVALAAAWTASVRARPVRRRVASVSDGN
jgi:hypothetical protein